jgi:hypothetical protein
VLGFRAIRLRRNCLLVLETIRAAAFFPAALAPGPAERQAVICARGQKSHSSRNVPAADRCG